MPIDSNPGATDARRWPALAVLLTGTLLPPLDFFIVNVTLPSIRTDLHASADVAQLVVSVYAMAYAVILGQQGMGRQGQQRLEGEVGDLKREIADVKAIAAAAEAEALKNNWAVTIAIVDDGGHLLWLQRLDGAPAISSHIAPAKAHTAALGRRESKVYEDVINQGRTSFLSAPTIAGMLEGGVPVMKDGQCIGAVGVSGVKSNEDAQIARAGIAAIGL